MADYLDIDGLTYYDGKIKEKLGTKLYRHKIATTSSNYPYVYVISTTSTAYSSYTDMRSNYGEVISCHAYSGTRDFKTLGDMSSTGATYFSGTTSVTGTKLSWASTWLDVVTAL